MKRSLAEVVMQSNWKRIYALTVTYGYMYDIILWPIIFWLTTIITVFTPWQMPAPPLVPWEQLAVATGNLLVIGAVQFVRDRADLQKSTSTP
jgi:hypothetical protein